MAEEVEERRKKKKGRRGVGSGERAKKKSKKKKERREEQIINPSFRIQQDISKSHEMLIKSKGSVAVGMYHALVVMSIMSVSQSKLITP